MSRSTVYQAKSGGVEERKFRPDLELIPLSEIYPDVRHDEYEPFTLRVQSRTSSGGNYRVCLNAYQWNGLCNCQDFTMRKQPELERGEPPSERLRCWHIKRARAYYLDEVGRKLEQTQLQTNAPRRGQTATCQLCKQPIQFNGEVWQHRKLNQTHPALP